MNIVCAIGNCLVFPSPDLFPIAGVMTYSFGLSNLPGKIIVIALILGSIMAWTIMITKMKELRHAQEESQRFLSAYRTGPHPFTLFLKRQKFGNSPLFRVYLEGCNSLSAQIESRGGTPGDMFAGENVAGLPTIRAQDMARLRNAVDQAVGKQAFAIEENMGFLATAVTTAPFLGLLGTVWGLLDTFCDMAAKGVIILSGVAPGVAGALLTTVVGLLVALPSSIGYNMLSTRIRRLVAESEDFADELVLDVEYQCAGNGGAK